MKAIRLEMVVCLVFFLVGCIHQKDTSWKTELLTDMETEVKESDDPFKKEKMESLVPVFELLNGGKTVKVTLDGVYLVPKDDTEAPPLNATRVRIASCFKSKAGMGKFFLDVDMQNKVNFTKSFNNPAMEHGEPFIDGYWGIGLGQNGLPGFVIINPDSRWTVYETVLFGGYKTRSGDRANLDKLLIAVVYYKNKPPRPLKEVLAEKEIDMNNFVSANKWGYCPKLVED